jgi:hypothetical protein
LEILKRLDNPIPGTAELYSSVSIYGSEISLVQLLIRTDIAGATIDMSRLGFAIKFFKR